MGPINSFGKMFQKLKVEDLLEKCLSWKGGCSSSSNHLNNEGSFDETQLNLGVRLMRKMFSSI
jgi:hypothetical protein